MFLMFFLLKNRMGDRHSVIFAAVAFLWMIFNILLTNSVQKIGAFLLSSRKLLIVTRANQRVGCLYS